jgi:hypothetical protein
VDVLGHEDVAEDAELVPLPEALEGIEEDETGVVMIEVREAPVTTERDEVVVAEGVVTLRRLGIWG